MRREGAAPKGSQRWHRSGRRLVTWPEDCQELWTAMRRTCCHAGPARHTEGDGVGEGDDMRAGGVGDGSGTGVGDEGATGAVAAAGKTVAG